MPRENAVVERVRRLYAETAQVGSHVMKTSGEGEPDLVGVIDGRAVVIECKQPGERPRALQYARLRQWSKGGAIALWTNGLRFWIIDPNGDERALTPTIEVRYVTADDLRRATLPQDE